MLARLTALLLLPCLCGGALAAPPKPPEMVMAPWFSLEPTPGATESRLGLRAVAPEKPRTVEAPDGSETITVIGKRRAPTEEALHQDAPTAESWQSDAAQPFVPRPGESCSYKSGCFDPGQKGLFSTLPALLGDN